MSRALSSIARINQDARTAGLSYGQMQARKYEAQIANMAWVAHIAEAAQEVEETPEPVDYKQGRPRKPKPVCWREVCEKVLLKKIKKTEGASLLGVARGTLNRWLAEYESEKAT